MARMPKILRQILRDTEAKEEQVIDQDNELSLGDSQADDEQNRDDVGRSFWQTLGGAGEASESARADDRGDMEQRIDGGAPDAGLNGQEPLNLEDAENFEQPVETAADAAISMPPLRSLNSTNAVTQDPGSLTDEDSTLSESGAPQRGQGPAEADAADLGGTDAPAEAVRAKISP